MRLSNINCKADHKNIDDSCKTAKKFLFIFEHKIIFAILTLVGRGARYSGVMYLSPTLEIIVMQDLSLKLDVDDVQVGDSSKIVMGSKLLVFWGDKD